VAQAPQSRCVLLVDDDKTARYGMRRALQDRYRVLEAESAAAARPLLRAENPGLLLLDIEMPGESGLDFLREVKSQENSPDISCGGQVCFNPKSKIGNPKSRGADGPGLEPSTAAAGRTDWSRPHT